MTRIPDINRIKSLRNLVRLSVLLIVCVGFAIFLAWWWDRGADARMQARLEKASIQELQTLAKERDWDPAVQYALGMKLTDNGRHKEAVAAMARAAALNPKWAVARAGLGLTLARTDRPQEAETQLKLALALDPRSAFAHYTLGNLYGKYQKWQDAATHLKAVSELDPDNLEAQFLLSTCYGELYLEDKKMEVLEHLVQRSPNDLRYLKSLGYVYLFFAKFPQAEATYRRILALSPNDTETHYLLGRALAEQANTPDAFAVAEKELEMVKAKVSDNPGVFLAFGILYFRQDQPAKAIPALERAIALDVTEHKAWLYLGQCYQRVGREREAQKTLAEFERGTRLSRQVSQLENRILNTPEDTPEHIRDKQETRLRLVRVYLEDNNFNRARSTLQAALDRDPKYPEALKLWEEGQRLAQEYDRKHPQPAPAPLSLPTAPLSLHIQ